MRSATYLAFPRGGFISRQEVGELTYAGIAHKDIESAPFGDSLSHQISACRWIRDVSRHSDEPCSIAGFSLHFLELCCRLVVRVVIHGYVCALLDILQCYSSANASDSSCNSGDLSIEHADHIEIVSFDRYVESRPKTPNGDSTTALYLCSPQMNEESHPTVERKYAVELILLRWE